LVDFGGQIQLHTEALETLDGLSIQPEVNEKRHRRLLSEKGADEVPKANNPAGQDGVGGITRALRFRYR
jgi:hypothetical protein